MSVPYLINPINQSCYYSVCITKEGLICLHPKNLVSLVMVASI